MPAQIPVTGSIGPTGPFAILGFSLPIITSNTDHTLTVAEYSSSSVKVTSDGTSTGVRKVIAPLAAGMLFLVENLTSEGFAITFGGASGTTVTIPNGATSLVTSPDGINYVAPLAATPATLWAAVAAGASASPAAQSAAQFYAVDSSGAQSAILLPSAPVDGQVIVIKLAAATVSAPVLIVAGAGTAIEDPQTLGTFTAPGGTVSLSTQGALFGWKYQAGEDRWVQER